MNNKIEIIIFNSKFDINKLKCQVESLLQA